MSETIDTRDISGVEHRVRLVQDEDCTSPRDFDCNIGKIVALSTRYDWPMEDGDTVSADRIASATQEYSFRAVSRWLRMFHGATMVLPLYIGGDDRPIAGTEFERARSYIGVTFDQPKTREITGVTQESIARGLKEDIEEYGRWATGDAYGWVVERRAPHPHPECKATHHADDWQHVDSCWGFIGYEYAESEARSALADL